MLNSISSISYDFTIAKIKLYRNPEGIVSLIEEQKYCLPFM